MVVNCAGLPETLVESEIFGHVRGAFTGADRDKRGLLEAANGGTFILDEIGDLPLASPAKFLRALQEGEVRRLGSDAVYYVDIRLVSSTNKDLKLGIEESWFRPDLYWRGDCSWHEDELDRCGGGGACITLDAGGAGCWGWLCDDMSLGMGVSCPAS